MRELLRANRFLIARLISGTTITVVLFFSIAEIEALMLGKTVHYFFVEETTPHLFEEASDACYFLQRNPVQGQGLPLSACGETA
jgi:hypothetical protein